ncbi:MAG: SurA N-terminal domain-containing protein [Candidatus Omnitrophica bacterium]|nr:SurA N-terminal domain-containing protein [Candidatus Omnitrophota bacterium]
MLKILRNKKTAKKVWIGLAIIIIPAFALWGFGGAFRSKEETAAVGRIFGHNVSNLEFKESLSAVRTSATMQFGDKLPEIEKYLNLEAQAWQRLILLHEAKRRKINISDKEVINTIQSAAYFQDKNGFNNKAYVQTLRYVFRLQPRIFEEQMRQSLTLAKLYEQVTKDVRLSDEQIRQKYTQANQELNIHYIASLFSDFAAKIKPTDEEIASFFGKNKAMFKEPPVKDKPARIPDLTEIKDKVKNALIKEKTKKMAEDKIKECAEILKNEEFVRAAKSSGLKTGQTAFFKSSGQVENLGAAEIFWNTAKKLKDKELSSILSNEKGYYIIKLDAIKPIDEAKFAKEKQEFSQKLISENKNEVFGKFTEELIKKAQ